MQPSLERIDKNGLSLLIDPAAFDQRVLVAFSNRHGGRSTTPWDSLNLSFSVGDDEARVDANRQVVADAIGFDLDRLVLGKQVHGATVRRVDSSDAGVAGEFDGLFTEESGVPLMVLTADCAPVVMVGDNGVGVAHAGWRGLVSGVIGNTVEAMESVTAAWVGPCIHSCCYQVGPEVTQAFSEAGLPVVETDRVDIADAAVGALTIAGVTNVFKSPDCTSCNTRYFSHRRDGTTGRQGAFVCRFEK